MDEEQVMIIVEMISAAGGAKSNYMKAISAGKAGEFDEAKKLIDEGSEYFAKAHEAHSQMIATEASGVNSMVTLLLVHAEDQMMSAESFRIIAAEFIDMYKKFEEFQKI